MAWELYSTNTLQDSSNPMNLTVLANTSSIFHLTLLIPYHTAFGSGALQHIRLTVDKIM